MRRAVEKAARTRVRAADDHFRELFSHYQALVDKGLPLPIEETAFQGTGILVETGGFALSDSP